MNEHLDAIEADAAAMLRAYIFHSPEEQAPKRRMSELMKLRRPDVIVDQLQQYQFAGVYSFGRGVFPSIMKAGSEFSYERLSTVRAGDFTYPKLMAWEGALGVVPPECDGMVVSPEFQVFSINTETILPEILDIYFRTPHVWPALAEISGGTNMRRRRLQPSAFLNYEMPVPSISTQRTLVELHRRTQQLKAKHAAIREANVALIPAMLERLFSQQAAPSASNMVTLPIHTKTKSSSTYDFFYRRTAIDAYIVHALADDPHLGRTKLEKISHLIEYHCRFNLNRQPVRDAYGPNDYPSRRRVEGFANKQNWYACVDASNRAGVSYMPGEKIADALPVAEDALADCKPAIDTLIELLRPLDTKQCEIVTTLYAAWNDLLLRNEHPLDETILLEATECWHPNKLSIPASGWHKGMEWLRANGIIPIGQGQPVPVKKEVS